MTQRRPHSPQAHPLGRALRAGRRLTRTLLLGGLAGCASYAPEPLEAAAHRAAWHARTLEDASVRSLLEGLEPPTGGDPAAFDASDGLDLAEAELVALLFHPELRLARLRAGLAAATAAHAGRWEDPELGAVAMRIAEDLPDRWFLSPQLAFTVPLSGSRAKAADKADAARRAAELRVRAAEWDVVHAVRTRWVLWSAAHLRLEETERLLGALEDPTASAQELARAGELRRADALLLALEVAQRRVERARQRGAVAAAEAELRAVLGLAPEAPVRFEPALPAGGAVRLPDGEELASRNPSLAVLRQEYEVAERGLRLEVARQLPDLVLGPVLEEDAGQRRVGLFGSIPLPVLRANRDGIAAARVERELARAAYEGAYEALVGRLAAAVRHAKALEEARTEIVQQLVPLVERGLDDARRALALGEGASVDLLESLTSSHAVRLELIETRLAQARAWADLEHGIGPDATR